VAGGPQLRVWAEKVSRAVTQKILSRSRSRRVPVQLAEEILAGADYAINHVPNLGVDVFGQRCRNREACRMAVTAPEALAIADEIRGDLAVVRQVRELATQNLRDLARCDGDDAIHSLPCPLLTEAGKCAAFRARPLPCRSRCHLMGYASEEDAAILESIGRELGAGIAEGLSHGLADAGRDGSLYEFNSALLAAIERADASERWMRGEDVFAGCTRVDGALQPA
jgi:hypothetical protein